MLNETDNTIKQYQIGWEHQFFSISANPAMIYQQLNSLKSNVKRKLQQHQVKQKLKICPEHVMLTLSFVFSLCFIWRGVFRIDYMVCVFRIDYYYCHLQQEEKAKERGNIKRTIDTIFSTFAQRLHRLYW